LNTVAISEKRIILIHPTFDGAAIGQDTYISSVVYPGSQVAAENDSTTVID
jgi:hypothetical protein